MITFTSNAATSQSFKTLAVTKTDEIAKPKHLSIDKKIKHDKN